MSFFQYCKDKLISIFIFAVVFITGGGLLWLIEVPPAVLFVVEGFYSAGFFLILLQDYLRRKEFYDKIIDIIGDLEEISYLSEFLTRPNFQEGRILYNILRQDEKYLNDTIAKYQRELQEYRDYVETWVHEIKTPIAVSKLIMDNSGDKMSISLTDEMNRIEQFVNQMLYYSKSGSMHEDYMIRSVLLKDLVVNTVKCHSKAMISAKVAPGFKDLEYKVLTDPKWMNFILGQIISNAIKYRSENRKAEIAFSAVVKGRELILQITDNGIGIASEDVQRVFRKGFTGENGRKYSKSTGMGLYLCDTLCRKMGSEISLSSCEGKGTTISIKFVLSLEKEI